MDNKKFMPHSHYHKLAIRALCACALALAIAGVTAAVLRQHARQPDALERLHSRGVLRVAALESPSGCYRDVNGFAGFDCDLLHHFAAELTVPLKIELFNSPAEIIDAVRFGRADIGVGGLIAAPALRRWVRFGPALRLSQEQLVHTVGILPPATLRDVHNDIAVAAGSRSAATLSALAPRFPDLRWHESDDDSFDLLAQVASGDLEFTVAPSDLVEAMAKERPQLRVAFNISEPQALAWVMPLHNSTKLDAAVRQFLNGRGQQLADDLRQRYFGHVTRLDFADIAQFMDDVRMRLPRYRRVFEQAAAENGLDWRLLAAIGYQESHWNAAAESPTGVRGLMMLTVATAAEFDVDDRGDPGQSIDGAARYYSALKDTLPESISDPDRTWMALAAYNLGLGHLLDARQLAAKRGGDADAWPDVRSALRLLSQPRWFSKLPHGYARGGEAINFVTNVQAYYDLLDQETGVSVPHAGALTEAQSN